MSRKRCHIFIYIHTLPIILKSNFYHLNASCIIYATQCQNFDFKLRRDHRKNFLLYRRAYESVDDGSLSYDIYLEKR